MQFLLTTLVIGLTIIWVPIIRDTATEDPILADSLLYHGPAMVGIDVGDAAHRKIEAENDRARQRRWLLGEANNRWIQRDCKGNSDCVCTELPMHVGWSTHSPVYLCVPLDECKEQIGPPRVRCPR